MNATAHQLEQQANKAMQVYFATGDDQSAVDASLWYRQAHHIRIGRPLSKAQYRSLLQTRKRLLAHMSKREPVKCYLVPIRGNDEESNLVNAQRALDDIIYTLTRAFYEGWI